MTIIIKSDREVAAMRQAGRIVAATLEVLKLQVRPRMKTKELDIIAVRELERLGAKPSFKGYDITFIQNPFPWNPMHYLIIY